MTMTVAPIRTSYILSSTTGAGRSTGGSSFAEALDAVGTTKKSAAEILDDYVKMSPEERISDALLKKLGLSKEDVAAMSPAEQKAVQAKIAELAKQLQREAEQKTGHIVNVSV
jgi:hypothetical protein